MKYHVQTIWYNLEGDGFSHAEFIEAGNEDQACEELERKCIPDMSEVTSVFTLAELFY